MTREALYVAATRARTATQLYVENEHLLGLDAERPPAPTPDTMDGLVAVLTREAAERSATEVRREAEVSAPDQALRQRRPRPAVRPSARPSRVPTRQL